MPLRAVDRDSLKAGKDRPAVDAVKTVKSPVAAFEASGRGDVGMDREAFRGEYPAVGGGDFDRQPAVTVPAEAGHADFTAAAAQDEDIFVSDLRQSSCIRRPVRRKKFRVPDRYFVTCFSSCRDPGNGGAVFSEIEERQSVGELACLYRRQRPYGAYGRRLAFGEIVGRGFDRGGVFPSAVVESRLLPAFGLETEVLRFSVVYAAEGHAAAADAPAAVGLNSYSVPAVEDGFELCPEAGIAVPRLLPAPPFRISGIPPGPDFDCYAVLSRPEKGGDVVNIVFNTFVVV